MLRENDVFSCFAAISTWYSLSWIITDGKAFILFPTAIFRGVLYPAKIFIYFSLCKYEIPVGYWMLKTLWGSHTIHASLNISSVSLLYTIFFACFLDICFSIKFYFHLYSNMRALTLKSFIFFLLFRKNFKTSWYVKAINDKS